MQILELLRGDGRRALGHEVLRLLGLGKRNHVTDARRAAEQCDHAVETKGDAAVRGGAKGERLEQVTEAALDHIGGNLEHFLENFLLQCGLVDADRASAELHAVQDHVIMLTAHRLRIAVEQRRVLNHRRRERVVRGDVTLPLLIVAHEREIDDPEEIPLAGRDAELPAFHEQLRRLEPGAAKDGARARPRGGGEEDDVAVGDVQTLRQLGFLGLREKLHDGRLPFATLDLDEGEALRAERFRDLLERADLTLRDVGQALGIDRLYAATGGDRGGEDLEAGGLEEFGEVSELEPEARVGLVHAVAVHRVVVGETRERHRQVVVEHVLPDLLQHALE